MEPGDRVVNQRFVPVLRLNVCGH